MHYQQVIDKLLKGEAIPESVLRGVCEKLIELLAEESNLLVLDSPINIIGDVHGQFYDLLQMLAIGYVSTIQEDSRLPRSTCFLVTMSTAAITHWKPSFCLLLIKSCTQIVSFSSGATTNRGSWILKQPNFEGVWILRRKSQKVWIAFHLESFQ